MTFQIMGKSPPPSAPEESSPVPPWNLKYTARWNLAPTVKNTRKTHQQTQLYRLKKDGYE